MRRVNFPAIIRGDHRCAARLGKLFIKECRNEKHLIYFRLSGGLSSRFGSTPQSKSETQTQTADMQPPAGWWKTGSHPEDFDFYPDSTVKRSGKARAALRSRPTATKGRHAAMMQTVKPDNYRGKRIRLSGYLKTVNVADYSGFWLRIDGTVDNVTYLAFDNMSNRPVKGTTDWKECEVVLDVSNEAELIAFGVNLTAADRSGRTICGWKLSAGRLPRRTFRSRRRRLRR